MKISILGVPIDAVTTDEALVKIAEYLDGTTGRSVFTPNPEMLVMARKRSAFRAALRSADLAIPDGVGLLWAARFQGQRIPERVTGTDMVDAVCALAAARGSSIFLFGGQSDVAQRAAAELKRRYPNLIVAGAVGGGDVVRDENGVPVLPFSTLEAINGAQPAVLFVALGHGKQEEWIKAHLSEFPSVRVAMGIGGAFDFIAGDARRAPAWARRVGLEWLARLVLQPWRIRRILNATVVFPCLVIGERLGIIKE